MGHDTPAFSDLNNSIRLDPNYAGAYGNRARLFRDAGKIDRALADFDQSLRLDPDNYRDAYSRGNIHFDRHDFAKALADYDWTIRVKPDHADALNTRCLTKAVLGRPREGLADCEASLRLKAGDRLYAR